MAEDEGNDEEYRKQQEAELTTRLRRHGLAPHTARLMREFGFESLQDLKELTADDVQAVGESLELNMGESKRWQRLVRGLQEEAPRQETSLAVPPPQAEAEANEPEEGAQPAARAAEQAPQAPQAPQAQHEPVEWYEALKSMVFVKAAPHKDADSRCIVRRGQKIQVNFKRILDAELHEWVELTPECLLRLPSGGGPGAAGRGFALIDGTHLGLGMLLRGPLPPEECWQPEAVEEAEEEVREEDERDVRDKIRDAAWEREAGERNNWTSEFRHLEERKSQWLLKNRKQLNAADKLYVEVCYQYRDLTLVLMQALACADTTVATTRAHISSSTGLRPKVMMLCTMAELPRHAREESRLQSSRMIHKEVLDDGKTLGSYATGSNLQVFVQYTGIFEEDYKSGKLLMGIA